jgi:serine/threonine-protein kinase
MTIVAPVAGSQTQVASPTARELALDRACDPALSPGDVPLQPGDRVGDYAIIEELASGGFSRVYRARHAERGHVVALKLLRSELAQSREMVLRFLREAQAVNQIKHPNIIPVDECGVLPNRQPFLIMECLTGKDLEREVRVNGRASPRRCLEIIEPVCVALDAAHKAGFVHRDVKPGNVFLAIEDGREVVKLLDFGIAKRLVPIPGEPALTTMGRVLGTPQTMAPEQILGRPVGPATDVYGVGVLIFYLLIGRYPFEGGEVADLERSILDRPAPRPGDIVPGLSALDLVVARCLEKWPDERYATTAQLLDDLRAAVMTGPPPTVVDNTASAVYVAIRIASGSHDSGALDDAADALDRAEVAVTAAGYSVAVSTGLSMLALRVHDPAGPGDSGARQRAASLAADLQGELAAIGGEAMLVAVTVHAGPVRVSHGRPVGGPLLEVATWAAWPGAGGFATDEALRGVVEPRLARRPG